jgi:predicted metal-binding protein
MALPKNDDKGASVFVCITCGQKTPESDRNGANLLAALQSAALPENVRLQAVKCMGGCNHSCAVAVVAPHKISYLFGEFTANNGVTALQAYLPEYLASANGVVAREKRPDIMKDILIRLPNPEWVSDDGVVQMEDDIKVDQEPGAMFLRATDDV